MHAEDVDVLDLESGSLDLGDDPTERAGRIRTGENVFVHEEAPNEILILPWGTDAGDLEHKDAVVLEEVVHLAEECTVTANTDVLGHLEGDNLGVRSAATGNITVVEAKDTGAGGVAAIVGNTRVTEPGLVLAEGDTGNFTAVVLVGEGTEGTPAAADIKETVLRLQVELRGAPLVESTDTGKDKCAEPSHRPG